jgi:ATP-dependent DNA ligase
MLGANVPEQRIRHRRGGAAILRRRAGELPERLAPHQWDHKPALVDARQPADVWFEPGIVLEVLSAELTLSPNATAG